MNRKNWILVLVGVLCCLAVYIFVPDFHSGKLLFGFPPILFVIVADAITLVLIIGFSGRKKDGK